MNRGQANSTGNRAFLNLTNVVFALAVAYFIGHALAAAF